MTILYHFYHGTIFFNSTDTWITTLDDSLVMTEKELYVLVTVEKNLVMASEERASPSIRRCFFVALINGLLRLLRALTMPEKKFYWHFY